MIAEVPIWAERQAAAASVMAPHPLAIAIRKRCEERLGDRVQAISVLESDYGFRMTVIVMVDGQMLDWTGSSLAADWDSDAFANTACVNLLSQIG